MVVPTPTARPATAATSGFSDRLRACRKRRIGAPSAPVLVISTKSPMSLPAEKPDACPAISRQLRSSRAAALSIAAAMASYIASVSAFFLSGRFMRMVRIAPSSETMMSGMSWAFRKRVGGACAMASCARDTRSLPVARAYYSTIFAQPADAVWRVIRDFNNYPVWVDGAGESVIEDGRSGDAVGAVRNVLYNGARRRQKLLALSDAERTQVYAFDGPAPIPVWNFEATLRVTPVIDGDRAFVEWWAS